jgi:hypothetical protein
VLASLENLPAPSVPGINGKFGFSIEPKSFTPEIPLYRSWCVSVSPDCLEIFSIYTDESSGDILDGLEFEFEWMLCVGKKNLNDDCNIAAWIADLSEPVSLLSPGFRLVIEASTGKVVKRGCEASPLVRSEQRKQEDAGSADRDICSGSPQIRADEMQKQIQRSLESGRLKVRQRRGEIYTER